MRKIQSRWAEYGELAGLFFFQSMATGIWMVPLSRVLQAHGLAGLRAYAFATSAVAAFVSPLIFGALADRHVSPIRVLRWLGAASAAGMALATWSIGRGWPPGAVLALIQLYAVCCAPTSSIVSTIVFARLEDSQRQFGPLRAVATFGWMVGRWLISALGADSSTLAGYSGAAVWGALSALTWLLPSLPPPAGSGQVGWRERMGWDALALLKAHDHRVVFITTALYSIPLAAFYPFAPPHLQVLGFQKTTAWMSLGQVTEIIAMFLLAGLFARWRLKWIFVSGLFFGLVRYVASSLNTPAGLLVGVTLHGFSFTLFFITAQIYLNERVEPAWRARAQALMTLMNTGVGNLVGYLASGLWLGLCSHGEQTNWTRFWGGLSLVMAAVLAWFLWAYHGRGGGLTRIGKAGAQHTCASPPS